MDAHIWEGPKKVGLVKMTEDDRAKALQEKKLFKAEGSFIFAIQVPDDSVGCSGSRCSNCGNKTAYCEQRCMWCGFPFVGPVGIPQISKWNLLTDDEKENMAVNIYSRSGGGRLRYTNVESMPLTEKELETIEVLDERAAEHFISVHSVSTKEIRNTLFE